MPTPAKRRAKRKTTGILPKARARSTRRTPLQATIRNVQARSADVDPGEVQSLIDEEVAKARASFWTWTRRYLARVKPGG
jgi:hypothetical protein